MASATLASADAVRQKGEATRKPGSPGMGPKPIAAPLSGLSAAGNMAIQRASSPGSGGPGGPGAPGPSPAATHIGAIALDSGGCSCGGSCDDCKKPVQRKGAGIFDAIPAG